MKYFLLLTWLLVFADLVHAQEAPRGPASMQAGLPLNGSARITPGTEQFLLYTLSDSLHQPQSILTRTIEFDQQGSQDIIRVIQQYDGSGGTSIDTSTVVRSTLVPLTYAAYLPGNTQRFTFGPDAISGTISTAEQGHREVELPLDTLVFSAVLLDELIKALPLGAESAFRVRTYNPGRDLGVQVLRVVGSRPISLIHRTMIDTWVLTFDGGALPTTLWVAQDSQELIHLRTVLPDGSEFWKVRLYPAPERHDGS